MEMHMLVGGGMALAAMAKLIFQRPAAILYLMDKVALGEEGEHTEDARLVDG